MGESEYVDTGTLERWSDYFEGRKWFEFTSTTTPGLACSGTWSIPGELVIEQPLDAIPGRAFYFELQ
ncbi:MAG: hypothetical protein ACOC5I_02405 [Gemmatimonadota bacterium]